MDETTAGRLTRLRAALLAAGYTVEGVAELLGDVAGTALMRAETVPAQLRTEQLAATVGGAGALATLVRLFALQLPVSRTAAAGALPLEDATALGWLRQDPADDGRVLAQVDVRPYGEAAAEEPTCWWVVSDLGTGLDGVHRPLPADHVLGIGGASLTLAQLTPRRRVGRALDVGTGCGVQALHLAQHAEEVVATDVLPRALELAAAGFALSGVEVELRSGDLLAPVEGETFDLVVSNPPFVVSPPGGGTHTYRDSGRDFDGVTAELVRALPGILRAPAPGAGEGGVAVLLGNWVHRAGEPWQDRVSGWLQGLPVDAWVVQREVQDPAEYVGLWLRDSGERGSEGYAERYAAWLRGFEEAGVEGVGFGWVVLRRTDGRPWRRLEEWPHAVEQPLGPEVGALLDRVSWLRDRDDDGLWDSALVVPDDVRLEQVGRPGAEDPEHLVLRSGRGMLRAAAATTTVAAVVGACDGSLPVGALVAAVAQVLELPLEDVRQDVGPALRDLVEVGLLTPVTPVGGA